MLKPILLRILDDDNVINTLEVLKSEAAEVGRKVDETDQVSTSSFQQRSYSSSNFSELLDFLLTNNIHTYLFNNDNNNHKTETLQKN